MNNWHENGSVFVLHWNYMQKKFIDKFVWLIHCIKHEKMNHRVFYPCSVFKLEKWCWKTAGNGETFRVYVESFYQLKNVKLCCRSSKFPQLLLPFDSPIHRLSIFPFHWLAINSSEWLNERKMNTGSCTQDEWGWTMRWMNVVNCCSPSFSSCVNPRD